MLLILNQTQLGKCQRQGCVYVLECKTCKAEGGQRTVYVGESARTPYDRGLEHLGLISREDRESPCVEHRDKHHPNQEVDFSMAILSFPRTTLQRQCTEAHQMDVHRELKKM